MLRPNDIARANMPNRATVSSTPGSNGQLPQYLNAEHPQDTGSAARRQFGTAWYNWNPGMQVWTIDYGTPAASAAPDPTRNVTDVITGANGNLTDAQQLAHSQTARTLDALRQGVNRGQTQSNRYLRQNLAQRGMLDSGSLGAGITRIASDTQGRLAAGTQSALQGETQNLLDLLKQEKDRQWQERMMREGWANQNYQSEVARNAQRDSQPKWYEQILGGVGASLGPLAYLLMGSGGNRSSNSGSNS